MSDIQIFQKSSRLEDIHDLEKRCPEEKQDSHIDHKELLTVCDQPQNVEYMGKSEPRHNGGVFLFLEGEKRKNPEENIDRSPCNHEENSRRHDLKGKNGIQISHVDPEIIGCG